METSISSYLGHYSAAKETLGTTLGATEDLLHLHAGLIIFFAAALFLRHRMRSRVPIALVYIFAFGNEAIDAYSHQLICDAHQRNLQRGIVSV
ncbi:MAG: hypothetical protein KKD08_11615 [Alphaproteobacteria bacterium]|nr:hypothetical protein [Alphaproteobacteria bacterium]